MLAVIAILIVAAAAAGVVLNGSSRSTRGSSTAAATLSDFTVVSDNLTVGFQGGLWQIEFQTTGGRQVSSITVALFTPTKTLMCSGVFGGLDFANCSCSQDSSSCATLDPSHANGFPANFTFSGYTTGAGAGSATPGKSYTVALTAQFTDGTQTNETTSVTAISGD